MTVESLLIVIGVPMVLVGFFVLPRIRYGLNIADEGYLVLGVQKVLAGEVPIRDFRAYDPGRYYFCALFGLFFGRGFRSVRLAMAFVAFGSLVVVAAMILAVSNSPLLASVTCVLILMWLQERYKQIENFFCLLSVALLYGLTLPVPIIDPFLIGLAIGAAAFFGLNLLVYMIGSTLLVFLFVAGWDVTTWHVTSLRTLAGLTLALSPVLLLILFARGYFRNYVSIKVTRLAKRGSTNLKGHLPWVWSRKKSLFDLGNPNRAVVFKLIFNLIPATCLTIVAGVAWQPSGANDPLLHLALVAGLVSLVNFHHTMARADTAHLFLSALPFIVALAAVMARGVGPEFASIILILLAVGSAWLVYMQPQHTFGRRGRRPFIGRFTAESETFWLPKQQAAHLTSIGALIKHHTKPGDTLLAVPTLASLYALYNRKPAAYDTYPVYPSTEQARDAMLADLQTTEPKLILIGKNAVDHRPELIFLTNYPNIGAYLDDYYQKIGEFGGVEAFVLPNVTAPIS